MFIQLFDLLIKIGLTFILSFIYTTVIFIVLFISYKITRKSFLNSIFERGVFYFIIIQLTIGAILWSYSFSYWENTGLGDSPQLPIGYGQVVYSPDFAWTYFFPDLSKTELNQDELKIEEFIILNEFLCAKVSNFYSDDPDYEYIVCDLSQKWSKTFQTKEDYIQYALENKLPLPEKLYSFEKHFEEYHLSRPKWKKYLLP